MPLLRFRPTPVVTVHRDTLLNGWLSPTSRLLYAVLLACLDDDVDLEKVAALVGVQDAEALEPFLGELSTVGVVEVGEHAGKGSVLTVHEMPLIPEQRTHACVPCEDCGGCSCEYMKGLCHLCASIRSVRKTADEDIARWQRQVEEGKTYAIGANATRIHRWDCKSLNSVEKGSVSLDVGIQAARTGGGHAYLHWPRLPMLYTAEELRRKGTKKRNCANCGPDPL